MTAVYYVWILVAWHIQQVKTHKPFDGLILSSLCVCAKTVITYDIIQLCRGHTGLIPGVGQRSSRCQTRISGRDAFLTYCNFGLKQRVFPAAPCFQFAVVLRFEPDQPTIRATCFFPLYDSDSGKQATARSTYIIISQKPPSYYLPPKCPCYS